MTFKQLKKQIQREVKASPQKAAALGLALAVGLYFWVPMLWGLVSQPGKSSTETIDTQTALSRLGATISTTQSTAVQQSTELPWQEVAAAIDRDPLMSCQCDLALARNPFAQSTMSVDQQEPEVPVEVEPVRPQVTPQSAGLALTSTMIGAKRRVAVINGEVYLEGSKVEAGEGVAFYLAQVLPSRVVLELDGQEYPLNIERKPSAIRIEQPEAFDDDQFEYGEY